MDGGEAARDADAVAAAHARLLRDSSIQFDFSAPPPPREPPSWLVDLLRSIGKAVQAVGPGLVWVMWGLLAIGVIAILVLVLREVVRAPAARPRTTSLRGADDWRPARAKAVALLEDADRLAAEGRYAEAAHLLLFRSVADAEARRPGVIGPSFTSRDIARLPDLPPEPRRAFGRIAEVVERAVFGGRPVAQVEWADCRQAYTDFAFPDAWAAR
jgi:hypothetical protein